MPHNIVETAREAGTFQTLLTAVDAAGLGDTFADATSKPKTASSTSSTKS
jgi:uncharacterized surface protein with fasciclin (FAS1) repeats